jgi:hypothetical protein
LRLAIRGCEDALRRGPVPRNQSSPPRWPPA